MLTYVILLIAGAIIGAVLTGIWLAYHFTEGFRNFGP